MNKNHPVLGGFFCINLKDADTDFILKIYFILF